MDSARIATSDGSKIVLSVAPDASFVVGPGQGQSSGANQLTNVASLVSGAMEWNRGPLLLDNSVLEIAPAGRMTLRGPTLSLSDPKRGAAIVNRGTLIVDGSALSGATQNIGVAVESDGPTFNVTGNRSVLHPNAAALSKC
jgi:hypothetical protein